MQSSPCVICSVASTAPRRRNVVLNDCFRVRECYLPSVLSYLRPELLYVVHACPLASVAVSGDCYSLGYSVAREPVPGACGLTMTAGPAIPRHAELCRKPRIQLGGL
jgi:hypothetical protein